jgi:DNA-binding NarL/FixJ family response regulator
VIQNLFESMEAGASSNGSEGAHRPTSALTQRETDILALLAEGKSNRDISRALYLSEKTVKAHLAAIFRKLGVSNRTQAAMAAVSMGLGPTPQGFGTAVGLPAGRGTR